MKYLPILEELISSDSVFILLIGAIVGFIFVLKNKKAKKSMISTIVAFVIYGVCEILSNLIYNYLLTIILLFVGCFALGFAICLLVTNIVVSIKNHK